MTINEEISKHALNGNWGALRKMIAELPEPQRKDTIEMLRKSNNDLGKVFPDEHWFQKRADEVEAERKRFGQMMADVA
jgi:hypothetical protein